MRSGAAAFRARLARPRARRQTLSCYSAPRIPLRSRLTQSPAYITKPRLHLNLTITSDPTDHSITSDSTQTSQNPSVYAVSTEESRHAEGRRPVVVITIVTHVSKLCIEPETSRIQTIIEESRRELKKTPNSRSIQTFPDECPLLNQMPL